MVSRKGRIDVKNGPGEILRDHFFLLFHASPVATLLTERADGTVIEANAAYLRYFGFEREQVIGLKAVELGCYSDPSDAIAFHELVQMTGHVDGFEMRLKDRAGRERVALVSAESVSMGNRPVMLSTYVDITGRKKAEERVHELATELWLAQERERKRIAGLLHDDVQQMLYAVQMQAQMGLEGEVDEMKEALTYIANSIVKILEITGSLSSELGAASWKSDRLRDGFLWVCDLMAECYGVEVELTVAEDVMIPDSELRQVVLRLVRELLFNTVKHAGVKRAALRAKLEGEKVTIQVEDAGVGFDLNTIKMRPSSTAQGLMRLAKCVQSFGGYFHVDSAPGKGTRATIILPYAP